MEAIEGKESSILFFLSFLPLFNKLMMYHREAFKRVVLAWLPCALLLLFLIATVRADEERIQSKLRDVLDSRLRKTVKESPDEEEQGLIEASVVGLPSPDRGGSNISSSTSSNSLGGRKEDSLKWIGESGERGPASGSRSGQVLLGLNAVAGLSGPLCPQIKKSK